MNIQSSQAHSAASYSFLKPTRYLHCRRVQFLGRSTILSSLGLRLLGLPVELGLQFPWLRPKKSSGFSLPWYSLHSDHGLLQACIRNIEYLEYLRADRVDCPFFKVVHRTYHTHQFAHFHLEALYLNHTSISVSFTTLLQYFRHV